MKKFTKFVSLFLAAVLCAGTVAAETIVENGVTYESAKTDSRRLVRYSPDKPETEFTISDTSVEPYSFEEAKNLEKITISDGVFYIGEYAFKDCTSLKEVVIDKTWGGVVIPENAFDGCTSLDPAVIEELCWGNPFHDVYPQDTYYNAVKFVHKNGLMNGMSDDLFSPDAGMTRAMFVTVLGRLAEMQNFYTDENLVWVSFEDVEDDQWYTYYVNWAVTNDIVTGYGNGYFGVNDKVTIEQAAVILYRYAKMIETPLYDMEGDYTDTDDISAWADDAMRWVTATDIYTGYDGKLRPKQNAPRALVAEMLYNYVHETEKPDEIPEKKISEVENPDWGLTLTASDVTSTEMTLTFTQSGGNVKGRLQMEGEYALEVEKNGNWIPAKYFDDDVTIDWGEGTAFLPVNDTVSDMVSWKWLYGELPEGKYRYVKEIMDFRDEEDFDTKTFYAEFIIE